MYMSNNGSTSSMSHYNKLKNCDHDTHVVNNFLKHVEDDIEIKMSKCAFINLKRPPAGSLDQKRVLKKIRQDIPTEGPAEKYFNFKLKTSTNGKINVFTNISVSLPTTLNEVKRVVFDRYVSKFPLNSTIDNFVVADEKDIILDDKQLLSRIENSAVLTIFFTK